MARSTSALNWREDARYVVFNSASSGLVRALARNFSVTSASRCGSPAPLSCIQNSKPPVVPMPGMAGGSMGMNNPASTALAFAAMSIVTASVFWLRAFFIVAYRSLKGLNVTKKVAVLGLYWLSRRL